MTGRSYAFTCRLCGVSGVGENPRGPRRTRCDDCMFTKVAAPPRPSVAGVCAGCGERLPEQIGAGRPRQFCKTCRPSPGRSDRAAAERFKERRRAWREARRG